MKKRNTTLITISSAFILATITAIIFLYKTDNNLNSGINRTVFINKLDTIAKFEYELFYSSVDSSQINKVSYKPDSISYSSTPLTPYGSGFLETYTYNEIIDIINTHRASLNLPNLKSIFSYNKLGNLTFVSTSSGLDTLYIVDTTSQTASSPIISANLKLVPLYVYDIKETEDKYYILTAGVNSLDARIYSLSKNTFTLSEVLATVTDDTALSPLQFSLTDNGDGLFTNHSGIQINDTILKLDFSPNTLATFEDTSIALSTCNDEGYINASLINNSSYDILTNYRLVATPYTELLHCDIDKDFIYLLSYDHLNPSYRYYLNIYDIKNGNLLFSEGLTDYNNLRILDIKK